MSVDWFKTLDHVIIGPKKNFISFIFICVHFVNKRTNLIAQLWFVLISDPCRED